MREGQWSACVDALKSPEGSNATARTVISCVVGDIILQEQLVSGEYEVHMLSLGIYKGCYGRGSFFFEPSESQ